MSFGVRGSPIILKMSGEEVMILFPKSAGPVALFTPSRLNPAPQSLIEISRKVLLLLVPGFPPGEVVFMLYIPTLPACVRFKSTDIL